MRNIPLGIAVLLLAGCSLVWARLTYDFIALPESDHILYERGAEDLAKLAAAELPVSIEKVRQAHFVGFKDVAAIKIYAFNDKDHYANFSHASVLTRGSSSSDEVYLSPKLRERIDSLPNILVHELSHVHIRQYTGTLGFVAGIPGWFLEGMAVSVSSGGGAEEVTSAQARIAMRGTVRFRPEDSGSITGHKTAHDYGLEPHMYYRQASLFVQYLQRVNPEAFHAALLSVLHGARFRQVWPKSYGRSISELWREFQGEL